MIGHCARCSVRRCASRWQYRCHNPCSGAARRARVRMHRSRSLSTSFSMLLYASLCSAADLYHVCACLGADLYQQQHQNRRIRTGASEDAQQSMDATCSSRTETVVSPINAACAPSPSARLSSVESGRPMPSLPRSRSSLSRYCVTSLPEARVRASSQATIPVCGARMCSHVLSCALL